jgi:hypothetical protein
MQSRKRVEMEGVALVLLGGSLLAFLLVPFGSYLWLGLGAVGLVLVWASRTWSMQRKVVTTVVALALTGLLVLLSVPPY